MANLYITEYVFPSRSRSGSFLQIPQEPPIAEQVVAFTTATSSGTFNARTKVVRLVADANCHVVFDSDPTATANSQRLTADVEYFREVMEGQKVSVYDGAS